MERSQLLLDTGRADVLAGPTLRPIDVPAHRMGWVVRQPREEPPGDEQEGAASAEDDAGGVLPADVEEKRRQDSGGQRGIAHVHHPLADVLVHRCPS